MLLNLLGLIKRAHQLEDESLPTPCETLQTKSSSTQ